MTPRGAEMTNHGDFEALGAVVESADGFAVAPDAEEVEAWAAVVTVNRDESAPWAMSCRRTIAAYEPSVGGLPLADSLAGGWTTI